MLFLLIGYLQKLKLGKNHGILMILLHVRLISHQLQKLCFLYQKPQKTNIPQQVTGGNSTTQENIRISRLKGRLRSIYKKRKNSKFKPIIENLQENKQVNGAKFH